MGRESYSENEVPAGLWHARFQRIIRGKRGQKILRELEAILLAMPRKQLAKDHVVTWTGQACLLGEYVIAQQVKAGIDRDGAIVDLLLDDYEEWTSMERSARLGTEFGIPWTLAWELAWANDLTVQEMIAQGERCKSATWNPETGGFDYTEPEYVSPGPERHAACLKLVQAWIAEGQHG